MLVFLYLEMDLIFRNLIQKSREYNFPINIKLIVSDNPNAKRNYLCKKK